MMPTDDCRCCLAPLDDCKRFSLAITEESINSSVNLADLISDVFGIPISKKQVELCFICSKCRQSLIDFYKWKAVVLDANERFLDLLEEPSVETEKVTVQDPSAPEKQDLIAETLKPLTKTELRKRRDLAKELHKKEVDGLYHCDHCMATFTTIGRKLRHLENEHAFLDLKKFLCQICGLEFPIFKALKKHNREVHKEKPYTCDCCGKKFATYDFLKAHIRRIHLGLKAKVTVHRYTCQICGKILRNKKQLGLHHESFHMPHDENFKRFECPICGKRIREAKNLQKHILRHEGTQEKLPCPECDKKLANKYSLSVHIRCVHRNLKEFHCDICNKFLKGSVALRLHRTTHSDARPFQCQLCNDTFKIRPSLLLHVRRVHNDLPQVQCNICERWFKNVINLKDHVKKHDNKMYECPFKCGKSYPTSKQMNEHKQQAHFSYRCLICGQRNPKRSKMVQHIALRHNGDVLASESPGNFLERIKR